jgi:hypothetical protein
MIGPFLIKLVEEPDTFARYLSNPVEVMQAEGLSDHEIVVVLSGDLRRLREALQEEYPDRDIFLGHAPIVAPAGFAPFVAPPGFAPHTASPGDGDES